MQDHQHYPLHQQEDTQDSYSQAANERGLGAWAWKRENGSQGKCRLHPGLLVPIKSSIVQPGVSNSLVPLSQIQTARSHLGLIQMGGDSRTSGSDKAKGDVRVRPAIAALALLSPTTCRPIRTLKVGI